MKPLPILLLLVCVHASEVNRKIDNTLCHSLIFFNIPNTCEKWFKREVRQTDMGPFWANRGKRDPKYLNSQLYADEPHWVLVRRDGVSYGSDYDPFFTTRGKRNPLRKILSELKKHTTIPDNYPPKN